MQASSTSLARTLGQVRRGELRPDGGGACLEGDRLGISVHLSQQAPVDVEIAGQIEGPRPPALADRHRPLQGSLGLGMLALGAVESGQGAERSCNPNVVRAQHLLPDDEGTLEGRLRLGGSPFRLVGYRKMAQGDGDIGVFGTPDALLYGEGPGQRSQGFPGAALGVVESAEIVERRCDVGVLGSQGRLSNSERALQEALGLGRLALIPVHYPEVVDGTRYVEAERSIQLFQDRQGPDVRPLGLRRLALGVIERAEVVEAVGYVGMLGTKHSFPDGQRALEERLGLLELPLHLIDHGQPREAIGYPWMVWPEHFLEHLHGVEIRALGFLVLAARVKKGGEGDEASIQPPITRLELLRLPERGTQILLSIVVAGLVERSLGRLHGVGPLDILGGGRHDQPEQGQSARGELDGLGKCHTGCSGDPSDPPLGAGSLEPLRYPTYHGSSVFGACFGTSVWKRVSGWRYLHRPHEKIRHDVVNDRICQTKVA